MAHTQEKFNETIAAAVEKGLSSTIKTLPSWLFYDEEGDRIFQQIMRMPEYYPTRCEYDILRQYKAEMLHQFTGNNNSFQLIELGPGDGLKTEILLKYFVENESQFTYVPVDISTNALDLLCRRLRKSLPALRIHPQNKTYDEALASLQNTEERKVILFMGANIGNFSIQEAGRFLKKLTIPLVKDDLLMIGFDLKKDPRVIQDAYDDPRGLTASFNLNILRRLNRELGADFHIENFSHFPCYDPETGATKSFLISMRDQNVSIEALERTVHFNTWEQVQTEISQKYDVAMIERLMDVSGLSIKKVLSDARNYFCDVIAAPS